MLPETHPPASRPKFVPRHLLRDYLAIFVNPRFQRLAGQFPGYLGTQLANFGSRKRTNDNAVMHTIAGRNREELEGFKDQWGWQNASTDWKAAVTNPDIARVVNLFEPLLFWDNDYALAPALAESVESSPVRPLWLVPGPEGASPAGHAGHAHPR